MNVRQALDMLGSRLEDRDPNAYPDVVKLEYLSNAEVQLANLLHNAYLTELEVLEEAVTLTGGKVSLLTLANRVLRGGQGILDVELDTGRVCRRIDPRKRGELNNSWHSDQPSFWTFNNYLHVNPSSAASVDVSYLRMPPVLLHNFAYTALGSPSTTGFIGTAGQGLDTTTNDIYKGTVIYNAGYKSSHIVTAYTAATRTFTVSPAATANFGASETPKTFYFLTNPFTLTNIDAVSFALNPSLHEIILLLAEASAWAQSNNVSRRDSAHGKAVDMITALNARYETPDGIGTNSVAQGR